MLARRYVLWHNVDMTEDDTDFLNWLEGWAEDRCPVCLDESCAGGDPKGCFA